MRHKHREGEGRVEKRSRKGHMSGGSGSKPVDLASKTKKKEKRRGKRGMGSSRAGRGGCKEWRR